MNKILEIGDLPLIKKFYITNNLNYNEYTIYSLISKKFLFASMGNNEIVSLIKLIEKNGFLAAIYYGKIISDIDEVKTYFSNFNMKIFLMDVDVTTKELYEKHNYAVQEKLVKYHLSPYKTEQTKGIHRVKAIDLEIIYEINQGAFGKFWEQTYESLKNTEAIEKVNFFKYEEDNKILGYIIYDNNHIMRLAVSPIFQGKGVGRKLLKYAINDLFEKGAQLISLNTQINNEKSRPLYESFGFREICTTYVLKPL